jgi:drug/metabolite transporter (DMT)-like permease
MILNRKAIGEGGALKMQYLISVFALPVLVVLTLLTTRDVHGQFSLPMPSTSLVIKCAIVSVTASCAHGLLYMATERASAAVIAPMTYVQLIVSILIGYFAYGDVPDLTAMAGSALIVGAGLVLWRIQAR